MQREIKFRAWVKNEKRMTKAFNLSDYIIDHGFYGFTDYAWPDDMILIQFTGLKDKNNKEIYEGDLLNVEHVNLKGTKKEYVDEEFTAQVLYHGYQGCFKYTDLDGSHEESLIFNHRSSIFEVVGNIYENPDIL